LRFPVLPIIDNMSIMTINSIMLDKGVVS
jgi:hypothetical protein